MEIIIDFDNISNVLKKEWLISTLNIMGIGYHTSEHPQTLEQYNRDLEEGDKEIENGDFITAEELKKKSPNGNFNSKPVLLFLTGNNAKHNGNYINRF